MAKPQVVFEDRWLLVVDKPSGLPTQATRDGAPGLFETLRAERPYVGLHHRLDQPASGLVLFTVDRAANAGITTALRTRTMVRVYAAVLYGLCEAGTWTAPVGGRSAKTDIEVAGTHKGLTAAWCTLHSGRKHQIRIHSALAGVPVVGDRRYGGDSSRRWSRLALHAARLSLAHPITGARLDLKSPVPADLEPLWRETTSPSLIT